MVPLALEVVDDLVPGVVGFVLELGVLLLEEEALLGQLLCTLQLLHEFLLQLGELICHELELLFSLLGRLNL